MSASEEEKKSYLAKPEENKKLLRKTGRKNKFTSQKRKQKTTYFIKTETKTKLLHKNGNKLFFILPERK